MSIRIKLLIACLVLLGVFVGKGFYAQQTVNSLGKLAVDMYDGPVMSVNYVQLAVRGFEDADDFLSTTTQFDNRVNWQEAVPQFDSQIKELLENFSVVKERATTDESRAKVDEAVAVIEQWRAAAIARLGGTEGGADRAARRQPDGCPARQGDHGARRADRDDPGRWLCRA